MKMSAQMSEDDIFLRAALKGEFTQPCNSCSSKKRKKAAREESLSPVLPDGRPPTHSSGKEVWPRVARCGDFQEKTS